MAKYNYKAIDIFNKEFKVKMRGFDPDEVDEFLDNIMKDYETFNKEILALQEENDRLNAKINQLNKSQAVMSKIQPESQTPDHKRRRCHCWSRGPAHCRKWIPLREGR